MHTGEIHILFIYIVDIVSHHFISLLSGIGHRTIDSLSFTMLSHHIVALCLIVNLAAIGRPIEQRRLAVLLTIQVTTQREDVVWRIFTHRGTGFGSDEDNAIAAIANQYHEQANQ